MRERGRGRGHFSAVRATSLFRVALAGGVLAFAGSAFAAGPVAYDQFPSSTPLQVTIPGVTDDGPLPVNYTTFGRNISPALTWTAGPAATKSFVVVLQDPDAPLPQPVVHWLVWAIPARVLSLPKAMRNVSEPDNPLGSRQGANTHGTVGYSGPHPPAGDPPHHYHFQVFALDRPVRLGGGAAWPAVARAMQGHVVAKGRLVATFAAPKAPTAQKTPPLSQGLVQTPQ